MQKHSTPGSLEDQEKRDVQKWIWSQNTGNNKIMEIPADYAKCSPFGKTNVDLAPKPCKFTVNQVVWRIRISKLKLGLVPNSCKYIYTVHQVVWTIRIRKVRFPKLNSHRELEAFVDICLILDDQDPKIESRFSPKIMQRHCKPGGLEDKDPKTESGFSHKIMQIHANILKTKCRPVFFTPHPQLPYSPTLKSRPWPAQ